MKLPNPWRRLLISRQLATEQTGAGPVRPRVLLIIYNPTIFAEGGRKLHQVLQWRDPDDLVARYITDLADASHGYLRYELVERIEVDGFPVKADGFVYDAESYLYRWRSRTGFHYPDRVDYARLLQQFDVIERINQNHIDEVWMMAFPYAGYYESLMVGPGAFWCNSPPLAEPSSRLGRSQRRFVMMGFNYERGVGEMLESFGHRVESIMAHVYRHKRAEANLWERFTRHDQSHPGRAECGTVHFAPNSERDSDWGNARYVLSRCDDWYNFPRFQGVERRVNCQEWGNGNIRAHHLWWLGHLPHMSGSTGGISHNWWKYVIDPNQVR